MNELGRAILVLSTLAFVSVGVFFALAGVIRGCDAGITESDRMPPVHTRPPRSSRSADDEP